MVRPASASLLGARATAARPPEALTLAALFLGAAVCLGVAVVFPMSPEAPIRLGYVMIGLSLVMAAGTYALAGRLGPRALVAEVLVAVACNSLLVAKAHTTGGAMADAVAFAWLVVWTALFVPGATALVVAACAAGFGTGLLLGNLPGMFTGWVLMTLTTVSVGAVLRYVSLTVRRHLATDPLTGALNRAGLQARTGGLRPGGEPISVVVLDCYDFKQVNDAAGHAAGDTLLAEAVASWRGALRRNDLLSRTGGDEFVLVLPGTSPAQAEDVLDRLRAAHPARWSAGVADWAPDEPLTACLQRADRRLYAAKAASPARGALRAA